MARDGAPFHAGDRLGKYELVREIGKGGFASVWLARLPGPHGFEQRVAIKLIRTDLGTDPNFQRMFVDEARLAAMVNHPNVVQIFELGQEGDVLYLVMEHVRGRPLNVLRNLAEREGLTVPVGIYMRILADTCGGLHAAHELTRDGRPLGVIHRDVSPHNILVSDRGIAKLIDFGVAKANDRLAGDTATGLAKGKIRYMAPEQALAKELDRRVDIWSVGAVAYDLIEGNPPFDGPNDLARMYSLLGNQPPPPMKTAPPPAIERVIQRALAREPKNRFGTAQEMKTAIDAALDAAQTRVTSDDVAAFFGKWLTSASLEELGPSESSYLHEKLALGQRRSVRTATVDVPAPIGPGDKPEVVETLSAVDSSVIPGVRPRRRMWASLAVLGIVAVGAVVGSWRLLVGRTPPLRAVVSAPLPVASPSPSAPAAPAIPEPDSAPSAVASALPDPAIDLAADPASSSATVPGKPPPRAKPRPLRPPATATPKPRARPRYDDQIQ